MFKTRLDTKGACGPATAAQNKDDDSDGEWADEDNAH